MAAPVIAVFPFILMKRKVFAVGSKRLTEKTK